VDGRVGEEWKGVKLVSIMRASREEKNRRVWEPLMQRGRRSRSANVRARVHREPRTRADVKTYVQCTWRSIPSLSHAPSIPSSFGNLPNHHPIPILRASIDRHFQPSNVLSIGTDFRTARRSSSLAWLGGCQATDRSGNNGRRRGCGRLGKIHEEEVPLGVVDSVEVGVFDGEDEVVRGEVEVQEGVGKRRNEVRPI
jgi:hypothetical protein